LTANSIVMAATSVACNFSPNYHVVKRYDVIGRAFF